VTRAAATVPADLQRAHRERWLPVGGRRRAAVVTLLVVCSLAAVGVVVTAVVTSTWTMLPGLLAALPSLVLHPRGTDVAAHGLRQRDGLVRRSWVPWEAVVAVEPPGRWRDLGVARLADGRVLELRGVHADDVQRLADALRPRD